MTRPEETQQDLEHSLLGLATLLTGSQPLTNTLQQVAQLAVAAVPTASGVGIVSWDDQRSRALVTENDVVRDVDDLQHELGEGPCFTVATVKHSQCSGSLGGDDRWRHFGPRAGRRGVHSIVCVPMLLADQLVAVMTVYGRSRRAFDREAEVSAERFAGPAAVCVFNAQVVARGQQLARQLTQALTTRATIDQAIGIIMSRSGATPEEAFDRLRAVSQRDKRKLADVARALVDEAVARARGRSAASESSLQTAPPY